MIARHEYDCDFQLVGICTCGAFLQVARMGTCPGLMEHNANLKKLRELLQSEKKANGDATPAAPDGVRIADPAASTGGDPASNV
jgi:hypothetical protein